MKHFGSRLLDLALSVLAAVLLLVWAWHLLRPLLPVLLVFTLVVTVGAAIIRYRRGW